MTTTAIILAAGKSSRLGVPKQTLEFEGEALLHRVARAALDSQCRGALVVIGAAFEASLDALSGLPVRTIFNPHWAEGMASSIRSGVSALASSGEEDSAALFCACDQPAVTAAALDRLIEKRLDSGCGIVASRYAGVLGVPALFSPTYYADLLALQGDAGARTLFARFADDCASVEFPEGAIDIDTPEDERRLRMSRS